MHDVRFFRGGYVPFKLASFSLTFPSLKSTDTDAPWRKEHAQFTVYINTLNDERGFDSLRCTEFLGYDSFLFPEPAAPLMVFWMFWLQEEDTEQQTEGLVGRPRQRP